MTINYDNNKSCIEIEKKNPIFFSCENETYWNTIIISQEEKKKC